MANSARAPHTGGEDDPALLDEPGSAHRRHDTIGDLLRRTRLGYRSEIEQVAAALRVRAVYLTAIEQGRYDQLPGLVYALGFVRTYANHLGLDGDEAVRRFKLEAAGLERPRDLTFPVPLTRRSMPGGRILLAAFILAVCGYGLWYYLITGDRARPERVAAVPAELLPPRAPSIAIPSPLPGDSAAVARPPAAGSPPVSTAAASPNQASPIQASPAPANSPTGALASTAPAAAAPIPPAAPPDAPAMSGANPGTALPDIAAAPKPSGTTPIPPAAAVTMAVPPSPPPPPGAASPAAEPPLAASEAKVYGAVSGPVRIVIRASGDSWIQVRDSDPAQTLVAQRLLHAGDSYRVPPDKAALVLSTGNASTLSIAVDGKPAAALSGTVRHNIHLDPDRLLGGTATE